MKDDDIIEIITDGKPMGKFPYKLRRSHKHLFNLSGIELVNTTKGQRIDKKFLHGASLGEKD